MALVDLDMSNLFLRLTTGHKRVVRPQRRTDRLTAKAVRENSHRLYQTD